MSTKKIIYQLALRTFTPDGTLKAATKLLSHIASLGVDIVYVCPFYVEDSDIDRKTWSIRQCASKTNNPKNPYKIIDYFNVDEEYGTNEDLKAFVKEAHKNGLLVMFDLVYLHCGKNAVFIDEHPDFVERNEDGTLKMPDRWPFVRLNFECKELREYLISNMEMLITEYGADGLRCDVGDSVPLDFWKDAFVRLKKIKPDLITLNEGVDPEYVKEIFDMGYDFDWNTLVVEIFAKGKSASELREYYDKEKTKYEDNVGKLLRTIDTHDTASDCGLERNEVIMTSRGVEAALVITNTMTGIPFLWNGYEVCDDAENSMFSNRFYGKRSAINWSKAFTADGKRRLRFIKKIHSLFHENTAFSSDELTWIENTSADEVISYIKIDGNKKVLVAVNSKNTKTKINLDVNIKDICMKSGITLSENVLSIKPYGYIIAEI